MGASAARLHPALVPTHIEGFLVQTDLRISRFSALDPGRMAASEATGDASVVRSRAELELTLTLRGHAELLIGQQRVRVGARHMLWIPPRVPHLVIHASDDFLAWVAVFRPRLLRRVCTTPDSRPLRARGATQPLLRRLTQPEVGALSALYASIPVGAGRDVFNAGLGFVLARSWLAYRRAGHPEFVPATGAVHPAVQRAAWLLRDGETGLSNPQLAARVGLSPQRLSRLFHAQMGTTLVDFRNRQRVAAVLAALEQGDRDLTRLSMEVGFGSYSQFHRAFKRQLGAGPAAYVRRAVLSGHNTKGRRSP